ncbi:MAG: UvrD-helicase domain-containing protein, partial [Clostridia bacterium]|nr:UvrD-helicase domain-containing protein [Clostridia bacterium]
KGEKSELAINIQAMRKAFKDEVKEIQTKYLFSDSGEIKRTILETASVCKNLGDFFIEFEKMLEAEKKRKNICTFSDLSRYSLRLLVDENGNDTPFADEQKKLYDAIYIDEYQDVNAVQNRIFDAISTPTNRFMVGDIKQSIYAFRGAEPSIFASLRRAYPSYNEAEDSPNAALFMSRNFRCNKEILDFTNHICDMLMPLISPDMNYGKEDALVFGKKRASERPFPVEMVVVENAPKDSPLKNIDLEAEWVANEIYRLTHGETKDDGTPITPGDIAILMRAPRSKADIYATAIRAKGIAVSAETDENLLEQSEVSIIRSFLECIDNPRRDISLAAVLLSPLCNIDCNFISTLRNRSGSRLITAIREFALNGEGENKEKLSSFLGKLCDFRKMARYLNAGEFLDALYADMAIPATLGGSSRHRRANLEKFRQTAYSFSASGGSLGSFLRYLRNVESTGASITAAKVQTGDDNSVHIMSVHKSKGLEFPVVFYTNTAAPHKIPNEISSPLYINGVGFGLRLRDESGFCVYDTMLRQSVEIAKKNNEKEEELRKLYVALTRAKERLYVCGKATDASKVFSKAEFENAFVSRQLALSKTTHFDIMMLALGSTEAEYVKYRTVKPNDIDFLFIGEEATEEQTAAVNEEAAKLFAERFDYRYPHIARTKIPAKLSISRLYPDILDDTVSDAANGDRPLPKATDAPRFIKNEENVAAKRGTATHLFMQFFDFDYAKANGAESELARLVEKNFITKEDASLVNIDEVKAFIASPLFEKMHSAAKIYREQRFNLHLPASEFASDEELKAELSGEEVLVQGVIDCFFFDEDGEIILVDYKTDRVSGDRKTAVAALRSAHSRQLGYYARAITEICGKPPKKTVIFSLALGDEVIV